MGNTTSRVSQRVAKALFAASGNICAYPGCNEAISILPSVGTDAPKNREICHIYSKKPDGP